MACDVHHIQTVMCSYLNKYCYIISVCLVTIVLVIRKLHSFMTFLSSMPGIKILSSYLKLDGYIIK